MAPANRKRPQTQPHPFADAFMTPSARRLPSISDFALSAKVYPPAKSTLSAISPPGRQVRRPERLSGVEVSQNAVSGEESMLPQPKRSQDRRYADEHCEGDQHPASEFACWRKIVNVRSIRLILNRDVTMPMRNLTVTPVYFSNGSKVGLPGNFVTQNRVTCQTAISNRSIRDGEMGLHRRLYARPLLSSRLFSNIRFQPIQHSCLPTTHQWILRLYSKVVVFGNLVGAELRGEVGQTVVFACASVYVLISFS